MNRNFTYLMTIFFMISFVLFSGCTEETAPTETPEQMVATPTVMNRQENRT